MSYTKNNNVTENHTSYIKSYIKNNTNVTSQVSEFELFNSKVTSVTLKTAKHFFNNVPLIYNTIYINNIKLSIFNVTNVTALYTFKNQLVTGYIINVT